MSRAGRPARCPAEILELVKTLRRAGWTLVAITERLNTAQVPTPAGSPRWYPSHVSRLLATRGAAMDVEERKALDRRLRPESAVSAGRRSTSPHI